MNELCLDLYYNYSHNPGFSIEPGYFCIDQQVISVLLLKRYKLTMCCVLLFWAPFAVCDIHTG